jgi:glycolate oxidase FAD binding subunit
MGDMGKKHRALDVVPLDREDHRDFWISIRDLAQAFAREWPDLICLKSSVLISKTGELLRSEEVIAQRFGVDCACLCHAGNGILYAYVLGDKGSASITDGLVGLITQFTAAASRSEGNLTVESCPLPIKERVNVWGEARSDHGIMRRLKQQIDPTETLNPGRYVGGL